MARFKKKFGDTAFDHNIVSYISDSSINKRFDSDSSEDRIFYGDKVSLLKASPTGAETSNKLDDDQSKEQVPASPQEKEDSVIDLGSLA